MDAVGRARVQHIQQPQIVAPVAHAR
jgi:hypothetical protein